LTAWKGLVAECLSFTLEGIQRQIWEHEGRLVDMAAYSIGQVV
jgi:hypothetical protein